jgi:hypothetical protein
MHCRVRVAPVKCSPLLTVTLFSHAISSASGRAGPGFCQNRSMIQNPSLDDLWKSAKPGERIFHRGDLRTVPNETRRYLEHAIKAESRLATAVRLKMHGEIKLKQWLPFSAEQVICWDRGMIWRAAVQVHGVSIRGGDTYLDGRGAMQWRLFGIIPVVNASGPDITRSVAGRVNIESIWLPSVLCNPAILWTRSEQSHFHARFTAHDETAEIDYVTDERGALESVNMPRWGNPEGADFHFANCGGFVEEEATFGDYTIPTRMRVGWHFGTERFTSEGEFFRVSVENAEYR